MTITELIAQYRRESGDETLDYKTSDATLLILFNKAIDEACTRTPLLFDATTASVCEIAVTAVAGATYSTNESIVTINKAYLDLDGDITPLKVVDRDLLDFTWAQWREEEPGEPKYLVVDETSVQLVPAPEENYTMHLEVQRTPLSTEQLTLSPVNSPVIAKTHHWYLHHWVLQTVYGQDDADRISIEKANKHERHFNAYFGFPVGCDRKRSTRRNIPHRNKPW